MTASTVKERPILFSSPMIRAILAGKKSQTRRVMKCLLPGDKRYINAATHEEWVEKRIPQCPYGVPGDRLWVREAHAVFSISDDRPEAGVGYRADHPYGGDLSKGDGGYNWRWFEDANPRDKVARMVDADHWRPSIFMPRWASRITLEVTDVRVQRLRSITEEDAIAEGVEAAPDFTACMNYAILWDKINGKRPGCTWSDDPFVWAISFRACEAPRG